MAQPPNKSNPSRLPAQLFIKCLQFSYVRPRLISLTSPQAGRPCPEGGKRTKEIGGKTENTWGRGDD